ncbi:MoaD/ThiS family protein, partial [Candidatus Aenigmatarchaeota archaeon]
CMTSFKVRFADGTKIVKASGKVTVENVLQKLCINPETVVVLVNGEIVPDFETVSGKDKIEVVDIVSRG